MKKYIPKKLLLISIVLITLYSCGDKKCEVIDLKEPILTAITIKDGSYFIYKDSITNIEDSFWVSDFNSWKNSGWCNGPTVTGYIVPGVAIYYKMYSLNLYKNGLMVTTGGVFATTICFGGNTEPIKFGEGLTTQTVIINGKSFNNTSIVNDKGFVTYYDGIEGLVKRTYTDSTGYHAWELVRSKIIR